MEKHVYGSKAMQEASSYNLIEEADEIMIVAASMV